MRSLFLLLALGLPALADTPPTPANPSSDETRIAIVFSGGHETEGRDRGRPVILVASALNVPADVFREAFTHVHPAQGGGGPTDQQARDNKAALMGALAPYGMTNERLDQVSNRYRYRRENGELWPTREATAYAMVTGGVVTGFVITDGGFGYSSPPTVTVPGMTSIQAATTLSFSTDFTKNGAVAKITAVK